MSGHDNNPSTFMKVTPILSALLLLSGLFGAVRELISLAEAPPGTGALTWSTIIVNIAIAVIAACTLVLSRRMLR